MIQAALRTQTQAFVLLSRTYSEVRRAITYLRWRSGDADKVAPDLYRLLPNGRKGKQASKRTAAARAVEEQTTV